MVYLDIKATIAHRKLFEFNQTKMTFINQLQHIDGYLGFTEKPADKFQMKISWKTQKSLNAFMKSELYCIFHGAIITLSSNRNIQINK